MFGAINKSSELKIVSKNPDASNTCKNSGMHIIFLLHIFSLKKKYFAKYFAKPNSCAYICNRLVSQKNKQYETGYFPGNSRPYKAGHYYLNCIAGNDTERHRRQLQHYAAVCFQTPPHTYRMRTGKTGTTRQGNLLFT